MDLDPMTSLDMLGYGELEMPGDSGSSKTETAEDWTIGSRSPSPCARRRAGSSR